MRPPTEISSSSNGNILSIWLVLIATSSIALWPGPLKAQEPPPKEAPKEEAPPAPGEPEAISELAIMKEEDVSIAIGLSREQRISDAPSNVYVITDEDIRQSGSPDLPTVLRRIPGMEVIQMTGADFDVSVRGDNQLRANKLLVLVDGRSIYIDVQGELLWKAIPVTLPEIKRIEVLKGPASALYGFNAFDGVVNIITKKADEMKGATLQFGGGAYGTISSAAIYANTHKKLSYRLSYGHDQNQQWRNGNALAFRDNKFNVQTEYALPSQAKLSVSGGLLDSNRYDGPIIDTVVVTQKPEIGYANVVYERPNFFIRSWWTGFDRPSVISTFPTISKFVSIFDRSGSPNQSLHWNSYNLESQHALEFGAANRLTYGTQYRHNAVSSNFLRRFTSEDRLGFYLQDEWRLTEKLTAVGGLRYDLDTFIQPTLSPRFSLVYKPTEDHSFRAEISKAYRPPTIFEEQTQSFARIFIQPRPPPSPIATINSTLIGSQNLVPENILSYDMGYQGWYLRHRLRVRADLFFNHLSNLVSQGSLNPTTVTFLNGRQADIYGGEAGIEFQATSWLSGFANYSFQEITQSLTGLAQRGGPKYKANVGLRGDWENGLNGEAAVHYYGAATYPIAQSFITFAGFTGGSPPPNTRVGNYVLLNLRGAYRFWRVNGQEKVEIAVTGFNSLNDQHKEHPLGDTIGSRVMGWLTIKY